MYEPQDLITLAVDRLPEALPVALGVRLHEFGLLDGSLEEDVLIADWKDNRYVCPRRPRLRMLEGLLAFHHAFAGGEVLVPETVAATAAAELEQLKDREPEQRSHILTSAWHVPLRWFVPFTSDDREVIQLDDRVTIRYRTDRGSASERLDQALAILEGAHMDEGVIYNVRDFAEWLENFSAAALVELDYGSVAGLFTDADLVFDESAKEVWESIQALGEQDFEESARMYNAVSGRWSHAVAVTYLN